MPHTTAAAPVEQPWQCWGDKPQTLLRQEMQTAQQGEECPAHLVWDELRDGGTGVCVCMW